MCIGFQGVLGLKNRISAIAPPKKRTKNDVFRAADVVNIRQTGAGIELAASQ